MYLYYPLTIYLAWCVYSQSALATQGYQTAVSYLDIASQSELAWKSFLETLSLNLYAGASKMQDEIATASQQATSALTHASYYSLAFSLLTIIYFSYLWWVKKADKNTLLMHLVLLAFICLFTGLTSTMLSLVAFRELPILGLVVFKFEAKSIVSVLQTFWLHGKYVVLLLVLLFSVIVPVLKLLLSLMITVEALSDYRQKILTIIHLIGKWSMTDVFVVAVLLAFFTISVDKSTDAWLGHGLYFFAVYSVLSMVIGHFLPTRNAMVGKV